MSLDIKDFIVFAESQALAGRIESLVSLQNTLRSLNKWEELDQTNAAYRKAISSLREMSVDMLRAQQMRILLLDIEQWICQEGMKQPIFAYSEHEIQAAEFAQQIHDLLTHG